jgi:hypothetical protein
MNSGAALDFPALEQLIFFAAAAFGALQAADKKQGNPYRYENGEDVFIDSKPVNQAMHVGRPDSREISSKSIIPRLSGDGPA